MWRILHGTIDEVIAKTIKETTTPETVLREYFAGTKICSALSVEEPKRYKTPITLSEIRNLVPNFAPPQSYIFLRKEDNKIKPLFDRDKYSFIIIFYCHLFTPSGNRSNNLI